MRQVKSSKVRDEQDSKVSNCCPE